MAWCEDDGEVCTTDSSVGGTTAAISQHGRQVQNENATRFWCFVTLWIFTCSASDRQPESHSVTEAANIECTIAVLQVICGGQR